MKFYILGIIISGIILSFSIYLSLEYSPEYKEYSTSIIILCAGFLLSLIAILIADKLSTTNMISEAAESAKIDFQSMLPKVSSLRRFENADDALTQIEQQLSRAKIAWNTRISPNLSPEKSNKLVKFEESILKATKIGLIYYDVVSENHMLYAKRLKENTEDNKGRYIPSILPECPPTINFIAIKFNDDEYDLYFGWPVSNISGQERPVFLTRDRRIVEYFIEFHGILQHNGSKI
ncbi:hypothetical protein [Roseibium sp.]|uniref:hypothetical protein n=1 Tax=Roseibium sp. TaxID=1936156 RepID=UPI003A981554